MRYLLGFLLHCNHFLGNREVDLRCLIIAIYHTPVHSNPSYKSYPSDVKQQMDHPRTIDTPFKYPSSDVDCVYAVDPNCKSETCLSVIKFWDGLQVGFTERPTVNNIPICCLMISWMCLPLKNPFRFI